MYNHDCDFMQIIEIIEEELLMKVKRVSIYISIYFDSHRIVLTYVYNLYWWCDGISTL